MIVGILKEIKAEENRVAIDQGGCFETSRETTHARPRTATLALTNATLSYALEIADNDWRKAMRENPEMKNGANVVEHRLTFRGVAEALNRDYTPVGNLLKGDFSAS